MNDRLWGFLAVLAETAVGVEEEERGLFLDMTRDLAVALQSLETRREKLETEKQKAALEIQFRHSQKMEAVGRLAGGVAHDFNNLLTVILNSADFALKRLSEEDPARSDLVQAKDAASRAASLVHQLLAFSRRQVLKPEVLDLNRELGEIEPLLRRLLGEDIDLLVVRSDRPEPVKVDRSQIEQVIANLAVNARDAMAGGGRLTMEVDRVDLDGEYVSLHPDLAAGPHVRLAVSDTGRGMDEATKARIFEPFFTTKGPGEGTGLGLSTVFGIVKQSGGEITVYSEPGKGTTFKVYLPVAAGVIPPAEPPADLPPPSPGTGTVLVVEDEQALRRIVERMLVRGGYAVLPAASAEEAIRVSAEHEGPIHLVLTDVVLPGMGGRALVSRLEAERPGLRVIYMSGYTDNAIVHQGVLDPGIEFIGKPFTADSLLARVRAVLGLPGTGPPPPR
jgi:signal transduction histidine kinase/CheY-like chemotaxis protein